MIPRDEIEEALQDVLGHMEGSPQDLLGPLFGGHDDLSLEAVRGVVEWSHTLVNEQVKEVGYRTVADVKGMRRVAIPSNAFIAGVLLGARLREIQIASSN